MRKPWWAVMLVAAFAGCFDFRAAEEACLDAGLCLGVPGPGDDAGASADAGFTAPDAGDEPDAGAPDAGEPDAGALRYELALEPSTLAFGAVAVGSTSTRTVALQNTGTATLGAPQFAAAGDPTFTVTSLACGAALPPQGRCTFEVQYTPLAVGVNNTGTLQVTAGLAGASLLLSGVATPPGIALSAAPSQVALPDTLVGEVAEGSFVVTNGGQTTLSFGAVLLDALGSRAFTVVADGCAGRALGSRETCPVHVRFAPQLEGPAASTVFVKVVSPAGVPDLPVGLSGVGYANVSLEVQLLGEWDAGQVTGFDGGLQCAPDTCRVIARRGTSGAIFAQSLDRFVVFTGYDGGGCGAGPGCTVSLTPDASVVTAAFEPYNLAFVTSVGYQPVTLGGPDGAAALCSLVARFSGLRPLGWIAALDSLSGTNASWAARVAASPAGLADAGWLRTDGSPFAFGAARLVGKVVASPVAFTEQRQVLANSTRRLWVAPNFATSTDCGQWASSVGSATVGNPFRERETFNDNAATCTATHSLLCLSTSSRVPVPLRGVPAGGRLAFVSAGTVPGFAARSLGDALCNQEARSDGGFVALLPTALNQASFARLRRDAGSWYRPDGVMVFEVLSDGGWPTVQGAPVSRWVDGGVVSANLAVWTGARPASTGSSVNCGYWTSDAGNGTYGRADELEGFVAGNGTCNAWRPVYCFER